MGKKRWCPKRARRDSKNRPCQREILKEKGEIGRIFLGQTWSLGDNREIFPSPVRDKQGDNDLSQLDMAQDFLALRGNEDNHV